MKEYRVTVRAKKGSNGVQKNINILMDENEIKRCAGNSKKIAEIALALVAPYFAGHTDVRIVGTLLKV